MVPKGSQKGPRRVPAGAVSSVSSFFFKRAAPPENGLPVEAPCVFWRSGRENSSVALFFKRAALFGTEKRRGTQFLSRNGPQNGDKIGSDALPGPLGAILGASWGPPGASRGLSGHLGTILGPSWDHLGTILEPSRRIFWNMLGACGKHLVRFLAVPRVRV